ncbi:CDP-alcohol phosphatidyltransferase family protein [Rhodomicrobium sp. Az07]|uniref:CDP-alcohol phosphatidyltransferase family protein n=1 Tax=Rhodomicrobium sp. Az07 TaxID=2839034 RepID=UPI001BE53710|nr:CDP-alcohol phosphatidyltransferase family protein [Rhodomicrobium sp. Az07]MBT3072175.1 CDP-alcohol phosphatidyltransferase family protein [Rhodomicrobium sp. Az07]
MQAHLFIPRPSIAITASRLAAAPLLAFAILCGWPREIATALVAYAAASDVLDGWTARSRGEVSALGAVLDPVADKVFVATGVALLLFDGTISGTHVSAAAIILAREAAVTLLRLDARAQGMAASSSLLAKAKTALQYAALLLLFAPGFELAALLHAIGLAVLWIAAGLSLVTAVLYFMRMRENRWT